MGRRKFHLSDMMPNAWFYKLRDMRARGRRRRGAMQSTPPPAATPRQGSSALPHRASYYYTTRDREVTPSPPPPAAKAPSFSLLSPPRSSRRRHRVGPVRLAANVPADGGFVPESEEPCASQRRRDICIADDAEESRSRRPPAAAAVPVSDGLHGKVIASETDIIIDLRGETMPERVLRPIVTRPAKATARRDVDAYETENKHAVVGDLAGDMAPRASSSSEQSGSGKTRRPPAPARRRLKTRAHSPRVHVTSRKAKPTSPAAVRRRSPPLADSFAVVKSSDDPKSDFLESMAEMIVENGIREPADLEDLLACYLSLNSVEYHGTIVDAFEQIWTSLADGSKP